MQNSWHHLLRMQDKYILVPFIVAISKVSPDSKQSNTICNMRVLLATIAILLLLNVKCLNSENIIKTQSGKVQGKMMESLYGRPFLAFHGIPYGEPPVGNLRFMPPVKAKPWQGVLDGTKEAPYCKQDTVHAHDGGSEDCLTLEVFTPQVNESFLELYPVTVYIFGGGYTHGPVIPLLPQRLMDYNIISVAMNFRLGIFGYGTTLDEVMPGNYGQLDQILALKWIHENIAYFGGDATRVTLWGHSSGSSQAMLDAVSPLSNGLIHGAILMSGFSMCKRYSCALTTRSAWHSAEALNCSTINSQAVLDCLRNASAEEIISTYNATLFFANYKDPYTGYMPLPPDEMAFQENVSKIPIMIGILPDDGAPFALEYMRNHVSFEDLFRPELVNEIQAEFNIGPNKSKHEMEQFFQDLTTDAFSTSCCDESMTTLSSAGFPIYNYKYAHASEFRNPFGNRELDHGVELPLLLLIPDGFSNGHLNGSDFIVSQEMLRYWTNFMAYGDPSPSHLNNTGHTVWEQWTVNNPKYLLINDSISMQDGRQSNHTQFWSQHNIGCT